MKYTSFDLVQLLRTKYPIPSHAFIEQVPNGTSVNKSRTADAVAMGCWKGVGIELHGFEIKISRADWLKEIQQPEKSAVFQRHCHRWWIVAAPGIVKIEEMPAEWGLMEPIASGLKVRKAASKLPAEPVSFEFLAGLLRRAIQSDVSELRLKAVEQTARDHERERVKGQLDWEAKSNKEKLDRLQQSVADFEHASGISINEYNGGNIGQAFANFRVLAGSYDRRRFESSMSYLETNAKKFLEMGMQLRQDMEELTASICEAASE